MRIQPVEPSHVHQVWDQVEPFLTSAFEYSCGDCNAEHAKVYLVQGRWQLLVAVDEGEEIAGAACVEYIMRPNHRVGFFAAVGGKFLSSSEVFDQVSHILKLNGATKVEGAARDSVARLWKSKFGFNEKHKIVEVSL